MSKWRKTPEEPNLENTALGELLDGLRKLQDHYESKLEEEMGNLAVLQQGLAKSELQKKRRKVDPHGG